MDALQERSSKRVRCRAQLQSRRELLLNPLQQQELAFSPEPAAAEAPLAAPTETAVAVTVPACAATAAPPVPAAAATALV